MSHETLLYSVRMRASTGRSHLSGAERLVPRDRIDLTMKELVHRALSKQVAPDQIVVTIDALGDIPVRSVSSLDLVSLDMHNITACRRTQHASLRTPASLLRLSWPHSAHSSRELPLMAATCGARCSSMRRPVSVRAGPIARRPGLPVRLERRGVQADRPGAVSPRLTHFRTKEALALATKVAYAPGIVAELCWSDEPDYTVGYVADRTKGYVRFPHLKQAGNGFGGRAFFVTHGDLDRNALMVYLQETPVLITEIGTCRADDGLPGRSG